VSIELVRVPLGAGELAVLRYAARRARNVSIVAGHGYSSSKHNLDFLCAFLSSHGFGVYSLDFPGHKLGASGGTLNGITDLVAAMDAVVAHALTAGEGPAYAMGHSMGAMTAVLTAAQNARIAGTIAIATGYGATSGIEALRSKGAVDFRSAYVAGIELAALLAGVEHRYDAALPRLAGRPQLYVAASRDAMVNRASVEELYRRAYEPKTFVTIDSDHTYAAENARSEVLQWLNALHPRS